MARFKSWRRWVARKFRALLGVKPKGENKDESAQGEKQGDASDSQPGFFARIKQRLSSKTPPSERPATWEEYAQLYAAGGIDVTDPPEPPINISLPPPNQDDNDAPPPVPPKDGLPSNPYTRGFWPAPHAANEKKRLLATRVRIFFFFSIFVCIRVSVFLVPLTVPDRS
jgi:hypothetical protein